MNVKENKAFFTASGHLTDDAIAMCVEGMLVEELADRIPENVTAHLQVCDVCAEKVHDFYRDVADESVVRETIKNMQHRNEKAGKIIRIQSRKFWAAAALLVILLAVAAVVYFSRPATTETLFASYFSPYQNIITTKSSGQIQVKRAMLYYDLKAYDSAAMMLEKAVGDPLAESEEVLFYLGNALLASGKTLEAVVPFQKVISIDGLFADHARWYLALAYLKMENHDEAIKQLETLSEANSSYSGKARRLLRKIDR